MSHPRTFSISSAVVQEEDVDMVVQTPMDNMSKI